MRQEVDVDSRLANERDVQFNPSVWSQTGLILGLFLSFPGISLVSFTLPYTVLSFEVMDLGICKIGFTVPMLATVPIFLVVMLVWRKYDVSYIIGKEKLSVVEGLFSNSKRVNEVPFEHIRSFEVKQNLLQRFFEVGDLEIGRASNLQGVIIIRGIRHPQRLQFMIERRRLLTQLSERLGAQGLKTPTDQDESQQPDSV
jgi:uncharacterized membrane protein YdbT with pleckstrin-like domain